MGLSVNNSKTSLSSIVNLVPINGPEVPTNSKAMICVGSWQAIHTLGTLGAFFVGLDNVGS